MDRIQSWDEWTSCHALTHTDISGVIADCPSLDVMQSGFLLKAILIWKENYFLIGRLEILVGVTDQQKLSIHATQASTIISMVTL